MGFFKIFLVLIVTAHAKSVTKQEALEVQSKNMSKMCEVQKIAECFKGGASDCQEAVKKAFSECSTKVSDKFPNNTMNAEHAQKFIVAVSECTGHKFREALNATGNPECKM